MRVWRVTKLTGVSPSQVRGWPLDDLLWAEAIEAYWQAEQEKALKAQKKGR